MITVFADRHLYHLESYLPDNVELHLFDPADSLPSGINRADALLVRTVIPINADTFDAIPENLQFIGTGSSGTDHVDIDFLDQHNIAFADAAGCNARSVAEYVATSLLLWSENRQADLRNLEVGIIGAGHVGRQVKKMLHKLGVTTVRYDPPRQERDPNFTSATIKEVLACPLLTFHTPLTKTGQYPTYHWLDRSKLANRHFQLILNTSRGGVIDETGVLAQMKKNQVQDVVADVWENEPQISLNTAQKAFIKTPHIAGYSIQAKENASKFVADALLDHFDLSQPEGRQKDASRSLTKDVETFDSLANLLTELHPIREYEQKLEAILNKPAEKRGTLFNKLRAEFPLRNQFAQINLPASYFELYPVLKKLGFSLR